MGSEVDRMAGRALARAQVRLGAYGSPRSRKDFTQPQLLALVILRLHLQTTYRGLIDFLSGHSRMREILGIGAKLPHYTTLQKFDAREGVRPLAEQLLAELQKPRPRPR